MSQYTDGLFASPEEIRSDGNYMVRYADELLAELNSFRANKNALMDIWHGASAISFSDVFEVEMKKITDFQQLLNEKGLALQTASGILSDAEGTNKSNAAKLEVEEV